MVSDIMKQVEELIKNKVPVEILCNDDLGEVKWSIQVCGTEFWLGAFDTKELALKECHDKELPVVRISDERGFF